MQWRPGPTLRHSPAISHKPFKSNPRSPSHLSPSNYVPDRDLTDEARVYGVRRTVPNANTGAPSEPVRHAQGPAPGRAVSKIKYVRRGHDVWRYGVLPLPALRSHSNHPSKRLPRHHLALSPHTQLKAWDVAFRFSVVNTDLVYGSAVIGLCVSLGKGGWVFRDPLLSIFWRSGL